MVIVLGEPGGIQGTGTFLQLKEVKELPDSSSRTHLCCMSQITSDHVTRTAAGLLGWEAALMVTVHGCVLGHHFLAKQMELAQR